ncbi:MAG: DUF3089 domain-containing protein [Sphingobium sp.]
MARKFLYIVAGLIVLVLAAAFVYRIWGDALIRTVMVPRTPFEAIAPLPADAYDDRAMWVARPDITADNPALWLPDGFDEQPARRAAAVFFIHPTSFITFGKAGWNMALDDAESLATARRFVRAQASAFNGVGAIWAPRYRQANFGAFLSDRPEGGRALDAAYRDVEAAFAAFLRANPAGPVILAGHSQGSLHLLRLMRDHVAGHAVADRIAAVYAAGWPLSLEADLPALGLPACARRSEARCILSWQSYAEPADPAPMIDLFESGNGLTGKPRRGTDMLCTNPITGAAGGAAPASANRGTLSDRDDGKPAQLVPGAVPARCDEDGVLMIGDPPDLGPYRLPGNNYHVYDYALFWGNVRADAKERLAAFMQP